MKKTLLLFLVSIATLLSACRNEGPKISGSLNIVGDFELIMFFHENKIETLEEAQRYQTLASGQYTVQLYIEKQSVTGLIFTELFPLPENLEEMEVGKAVEAKPRNYFLRIPKTPLEKLSEGQVKFSSTDLGQQFGVPFGIQEIATFEQNRDAGKKFSCSEDSSIIYDPRLNGYIHTKYAFTVDIVEEAFGQTIAAFKGDELIDNRDGKEKKKLCEDLKAYKNKVNRI